MKKVYEKAEVKVYEMEIEYNLCESDSSVKVGGEVDEDSAAGRDA